MADTPRPEQDAFARLNPIYDLMVRGVRVYVTGGASRSEYLFHVADTDKSSLSARTKEGLAGGSSAIAGYLVVGRFLVDERAEKGVTLRWVPTTEEPDLVALVDAAGAGFKRGIESEGRWPDFTTMLKERFGYAPTGQHPSRQPPAAWFWLTCPPSTAGAQRLSTYEDRAVYVEPSSGLLSIYTSRLAAAPHQHATGALLEVTQIPCLGCYLRGAASELGREGIRGALVDGQWRVVFHVCESHGRDIPQHFTLKDAQHTYYLLGCAHTTGAIWAPMLWESLAFNMDCKLENW